MKLCVRNKSKLIQKGYSLLERMYSRFSLLAANRFSAFLLMIALKGHVKHACAWDVVRAHSETS